MFNCFSKLSAIEFKNNKVLVYTKEGCPYCHKAKKFLENLGIPYSEGLLKPNDPNYVRQRDKLFRVFQQKTFPIILVGDTLVGGSSDLETFYFTGKLKRLCKKININF